MHGKDYYMNSFKSLLEKEDKQNNISEIHEENKYDIYFEGTEKLSDKAKYIEDIVFDDKNIGRKYYSVNKEIKYIEIFSNKKFNLLRISPNITFLHLYDKNEEKEYNENKFIGFRYYNKSPAQKDF